MQIDFNSKANYNFRFKYKSFTIFFFLLHSQSLSMKDLPKINMKTKEMITKNYDDNGDDDCDDDIVVCAGDGDDDDGDDPNVKKFFPGQLACQPDQPHPA